MSAKWLAILAILGTSISTYADITYDLDDATSKATFDTAYAAGNLLGDNVTLNYTGTTALNYTGGNIVGNDGGTNYYSITKTGSGSVNLATVAPYGTSTSINIGAISISGGGNLALTFSKNAAYVRNGISIDGGMLELLETNSHLVIYPLASDLGTFVQFGANGGTLKAGAMNFRPSSNNLAVKTTANGVDSKIQAQMNMDGKTVVFDTATGSQFTFDGKLVNGGSITKTGTGTLVLTNTNSFGKAGNTTTLSEGTVLLSADNGLGTLNNVQNNATLQIGTTTQTLTNLQGTNANARIEGTGTLNLVSDKDTAYAGKFDGSGLNLNKTGTGTLTIGGNVNQNTRWGAITLDGGSLTFTSLVRASYLSINGGTLSINSGSGQQSNFTDSNFIRFGEKGGTLTSINATPNFYAGNNTAKVTTTENGEKSTIGIYFNTFGGNQTLEFNTAANSVLEVSGQLWNAGSLKKTGEGTLILSGANTYTAVNNGTKILNGTVVVNTDQSFGNTSTLSLISQDAATATIQADATQNTTLTYSSPFTVGGAGTNVIDTNGRTMNFTGNVTASGTSGLTKTGEGALYLAGTLNSLNIAGGSYSPGTAANEIGTLTLNASQNVVTTGGQLVVDVKNTNGTLTMDTLSFTDEAATFDMADDSLLFNFIDFEPSAATVYSMNFLENMTLPQGDYSSWLDPSLSSWRLLADGTGGMIYGSSSALPEPSTWFLLMLGVGMLWRKRSDC